MQPYAGSRIGAGCLDDLNVEVIAPVQRVTAVTRTLTCPIGNGARP